MKHKIWKQLTCMILSLILLVAAVPLTVSAEEDDLPDVMIGEIWTAAWTAEDMLAAADLVVEQSGFYDIMVYGTNNISGQLYVHIYNITEDENLQTIYGDNLYNKKQTQFYLSADCEYGILVYAVLQNTLMGGSANLLIKPSDDAVTAVTLGTPLNVLLDNSEEQLVSFTTAQAGDYQLKLSKRNTLDVAVYHETTGHAIVRRTQAMSETSSTMQSSDAIVMQLEADTTYYMYIKNGTYGFNGNITLSKCAKDVQTMVLNAETNRLKYRKVSEETPELWCNYRVIYSDGSQDILTYSRIGHLGYIPPTVYLLGKQITVFDTTYFAGGAQPILADYNGDYSYASVKSFEEIGLGNDSNERHIVRNTNAEQRPDSFDFTPSQTGVFKLYTNDPDAFVEYEISYVLVDAQFMPVNFDNEKGGYPMVKGQRYRLYAQYRTVRESQLWISKSDAVLFPDTHPTAWYYDAVTYAVGSGIMTGYKTGQFGTSNSIQRQDFLVMLARLDGVDLTEYQDTHGLFPDVAANSYYEAAVNWGYQNGIVTGYNNGYFGVGDKITREQLVTFLYRYAKYRNPATVFNAELADSFGETYHDFSRVSTFAKDAMIWALEYGVMKGKKPDTILPGGEAQRCEVAQTMFNIFQNNVF